MQSTIPSSPRWFGGGASVSPSLRRGLCVFALAAAVMAAPLAIAEGNLSDEALAAQRAQAELQTRIDAADEAVRENIQALRQAETEARRLESYNAALAPQVERQAETATEREAALATLSETREALPGRLADMTERLSTWVDQDLPFLHDERRARVASLQSALSDPALGDGEKLERVLGAWRAELEYGRELDAWRGRLAATDGETDGREVDFLRLGRVGWYYLTPDGSEGGVWKVAEHGWQPLDANARSEVGKGMSIVRDQRAPALLDLPLSQPLEGRS
ncbi:DUF3450 domain-containing protein [Halomonas sp. V046]|uniref:DUF3450 domain-containing protein n=1 Tax=Halomonas sp. V046 TaxID=3459611 RepID=UPI004043EDB8